MLFRIDAHGHDITSQVKAWNDTIRNIMHNELIRLPLTIKLGSRVFTWEYNCTSHNNAMMMHVMDSEGR